MCNVRGVIFGAKSLTSDEVENKKIIEVGSYDINGSLRNIYETWNPKEYIGVDIEPGPGVDIVCSAEDIIDKFGENSFDIVISTELLEHIKSWRMIISNLKNICKPNGIIIITTRSKGFPYHGYPYDFWRFELDDVKQIFSDFIIDKIESDTTDPGVFLKLRKPITFIENNLSDFPLFSIITEQRVLDIDEKVINNFLRNYNRKRFIANNLKYFIKKSGLNKLINCI
jgi:SAM-dependent methyltransferase